MLAISENPDVNYLAQVFKISNIEKHPEADRLQIVHVGGCKVVTGLDAKDGAWYVYFSVESQIAEKFLAWTNSYSDAERNADVKVKGYFPKTGRVKIVKLRNVFSEGYIVPAATLAGFIKEFYGKTWEPTEEINFDTVCGDRFVNKYVRKVNTPNAAKAKSKGNVKKYESRLVDNQFRFHEDTLSFKKNLGKLNPEDYIAIETKIHGSSFSVCKVLTKRKLSLVEKIAKFFGAKIQESEYGNLYASRCVIKNIDLNQNPGFYDSDIWKEVSDRVYPLLDDGISLYGEVFGFTPKGGYIQPKYDYGCAPKECKFIVYKGTITLPDGQVYVMSQPQLKSYCASKGLPMAEEFYYGKAKDLYPDLDPHNHWHENFLARLERDFLEKKCKLCRNDVWDEGIIIKIENPFTWNALKLKSLAFLGYETALLDSDEVSVEEEESQSENSV